MARFDLMHGMIHFTFANEDKYFKEGLVCLNLSQNLYYELRKKGFQTVYFINMQGNKYCLTCGNTLVSQYYNVNETKGFLGIFEKKTELAHVILKSMKNRGNKTAYVFNIDAFNVFRGYEKDILDLEKNNFKYENLILIKAPIEAQGSMPYLEDPEGIYQTDLFPEIQNMFGMYQNVHLYDRMTKMMPHRISYLNNLEKKELEHLVRYTIFNENNNVDDLLPFVDDYTICLWYLYHSEKFRNWAKQEYPYLEQQFPINYKRTFIEIEKALKRNVSYRTLDGIILKLKNEDKNKNSDLESIILNELEIDDYKEEYQRFIFQPSNIWDRLTMISYDFVKEKENISYIEKKRAAIHKALVTPCVNRDASVFQERRKYIDIYLNDMGLAESKKNLLFFKYALDALYYAVCKCDEEINIYMDSESKKDKEDAKKQCLDCYKYILIYENDICTNRSILKENDTSLKKDIMKWEAFTESIEEMEKAWPDIYQCAKEYMESGEAKSKIPTQTSFFLEDYWKKRRRATELGENIEQRKNVVNIVEEKLMQAQSLVEELDLCISGMEISASTVQSKRITTIIERINGTFANVQDEFIKNSKISKVDFEYTPPANNFEFKNVNIKEWREQQQYVQETYENFELLQKMN